ncbi:LrgB [Pontibacillus halophilus JSM 076056 = DSM 19796]|uniref:LrgB n=1 Tax=Pontibacillus halophilus JSM 076056 = DSM 19796 TaxID=1385510 RepID=A0A0A5GJA9_9BACI|nr:LrgB family protein [Pontibacillus halophilus]KGX91308.1 LrgB [Pontibacillus halophilus JSM 076056 = DSM 19796]
MSYLLLTLAVYALSKLLYKRFKQSWLTPLLVAPVLLIAILVVFKIPFHQYESGTSSISYFLGPATVAFAIPMYKHLHLIKKFTIEIIGSITAGSTFAVLSSFILASIVQLSGSFVTSILPRSITTPIAMEVSKTIGGVPTLTAAFVVITGIIGSIVGPSIVKLFHLKSPVAKGLSLGTAAHGAGTSKAFEFGDQEGTFSSLAMIIAAAITLLWGNTWMPALQNWMI